MRSVCIVGFAPETREMANAEPEGVELWGMNASHTFMRRFDRWFQLHPESWKGGHYGRTASHLQFLQGCGVPVYMSVPDVSIPTAVAYPLEDVFKTIGRRFLTSSTAYALALAIHERVDEIKVYGVRLVSEPEYVRQRECVGWLIGLAEGRGITVTLPKESNTLLVGPLYPNDPTNEIVRARGRVSALRNQYWQAWANVHQVVGAYKHAPSQRLVEQFAQQMHQSVRTLGALEQAQIALKDLNEMDVTTGHVPDLSIPSELMTAAAKMEMSQ